MDKESINIEEEKSFKSKLKDEFNADKRFFVRILVIFLLLVISYYLFSPYQNCISFDNNQGWCILNTRW